MARPGLIHNIVRYVLEPTLGQQLLGFIPLYCKIVQGLDRQACSYYRGDQIVKWMFESGVVPNGPGWGYHAGPRSDPLEGLSWHWPPSNYQINRDKTVFYYTPGRCSMKFISRYTVAVRIELAYVKVEVYLDPAKVIKKLPQPGLKLGGSFEDAQLALKYLLDLKDQMIKLGY